VRRRRMGEMLSALIVNPNRKISKRVAGEPICLGKEGGSAESGSIGDGLAMRTDTVDSQGMHRAHSVWTFGIQPDSPFDEERS